MTDFCGIYKHFENVDGYVIVKIFALIRSLFPGDCAHIIIYSQNYLCSKDVSESFIVWSLVPTEMFTIAYKISVISKTLFCQYFHGTTSQPYILNPILMIQCIQLVFCFALLCFGLYLSSSVFSLIYLNYLPPQRSSSSPSGPKILEGSFQVLNKQIILTKSVAVTLCPLYWQLPRNCHLKELSFTECFPKCHYWQHAQQLF